MELRSYSFKAMGGPCEFRLYGQLAEFVDAVADEAIDEVLRLEQKYSRYRDDSVTSAINATAGDPEGLLVDEETASLLDFAQVAFDQSDGLFDITSGVLRRVWNFKAGRIPTCQEVDEVRRCIGWHHVDWSRPHVALPDPGMELDFGGYVKEYAADRAAACCRSLGVSHGLVDLAGDLSVVGPHPDGSPWSVGVRNPLSPEQPMALVPLWQGGLASSGDYERCMIVDGKRYGHILSPVTGWPVEGLSAVSVLASHCLIAGAATTIAMLKEPAEGMRWLDHLGLPNIRMDAGGELSGTLTSGGSAGTQQGAETCEF